MTKTRTKKVASTYWEQNGKYQKDYDRLMVKLTPPMGHAETTRGQLLVSLSKIYHDYYNNGFGNLDMDFMFGHAMNIFGVQRSDIMPLIEGETAYDRCAVMSRVGHSIIRHWEYIRRPDCTDSYAHFSAEFERDFEKVADAVILYTKDQDERIKAAK